MSHAPDPFIDTAKCCALSLAALPDVMSCLKVNVRVSVLPCDRGPAPSVGLPVLLSLFSSGGSFNRTLSSNLGALESHGLGTPGQSPGRPDSPLV